MSPIPSVAIAFAFFTPAPSVGLDPDSAVQSPSVTSQHILGTSGLLFAVVVIASVAGYFYRGRGAANSDRTSNTLGTLSGILSSIRHRGSTKTSTTAATDWPVDLEAGYEHVSTVYTKFFHPTSWNLVESHPATPYTPAIYVEDEAKEVAESATEPPAMSSLSDINNGAKEGCGKVDRVSWPTGVTPSPYETRSATNINFSSEIIGTTVRRGKFLSVPGDVEADSSGSSSDSELNVTCSACEGVSTPSPELSWSTRRCVTRDLCDTIRNPGAIVHNVEELEDELSEAWSSDSELDWSYLAYGGIERMPPRSNSGTRRYRTADKGYGAQSLKHTTPDAGSLMRTISYRDGLVDFSHDGETDPAISSGDHSILDQCAFLSIQEEPEDDLSASWKSDSDLYAYLAYDGIATAPSTSAPDTRRYGMADMEHLAQSLEDTIPEEVPMLRTISSQSGLVEIFRWFEEMEAAISHGEDSIRNPGLALAHEELDDSWSESPSSDSERDLSYAAYNGIQVGTPPISTLSPPSYGCVTERSDIAIPNLGPFAHIPEELEDHSCLSCSSDSEMDWLYLADTPAIAYASGLVEHGRGWSQPVIIIKSDDEIVRTLPRSTTSTRRNGVADMGNLNESLNDGIPAQGYELVPTISPQSGLLDVSLFGETDPGISYRSLARHKLVDSIGSVPAVPRRTRSLDVSELIETAPDMFCESFERLEYVDKKPRTQCHVIDIQQHPDRNGLRNCSSNAKRLGALKECLDDMHKLLAEVHNLSLEWSPRPVSECSHCNSEYSNDDEQSGLHLSPAWHFDDGRRNSLELTSSTTRPNSDVSNEGPIYPFTPPSQPAMSLVRALDIHKARMWSPHVPW